MATRPHQPTAIFPLAHSPTRPLAHSPTRYLAISLSRYLAISLSRYLAISLSRYLRSADRRHSVRGPSQLDAERGRLLGHRHQLEF